MQIVKDEATEMKHSLSHILKSSLKSLFFALHGLIINSIDLHLYNSD